MNIQHEKHKLLQERQDIEGTGRLSSRFPFAVELALLVSSFNSWCCTGYTRERAARVVPNLFLCILPFAYFGTFLSSLFVFVGCSINYNRNKWSLFTPIT